MVYSYSRLATYKQCPQKFKFTYIDKMEAPDLPPSPALERGSAIHDSVESYLNRTTEYMHPDIHKDWGQYLHGIREGGGELKPEFKWGITWDFKPCDYSDPMCMVHGYIDLLVLPEDSSVPIDVYEWKTGGRYDEHVSQLWLYSVAMLIHHPDRHWVDGMVVYFDGHPFQNIKYPQSMMFEYAPMLRREIDKVVFEKRWPAKPSFKCRWCKYSSKNNGGPCRVG